MKAEIISCGTELLLGHTIDTNAGYISNFLSHIGIDVYYHTTVGDNKERLSAAINNALIRSDIVIVTGGLGPTVDDITIGTIASVAKRDLVFNKGVFMDIKSHFKKHAFKLPKDAVKQALIPRGANWIKNKVGTAPGIILEHDKKYLIALPGPPRELNPMLKKEVMPFLKRIQRQGWTIKSRTLRLIGLLEAEVNEKTKNLLMLSGSSTVGIYAPLGEVELRITTKAKNEKIANTNLRRLERKIRNIFGDYVYGADDETLEDVVGRILTRRKKRLSIAESCTGGYISNLITNVPGSSRYFATGILAYNNDIKIKVLNVKRELLKRYGAVSKEVAKSMADNVRELAKADVGMGITGIAGPTGKTKAKPIGLVYIALSSKKKSLVKKFRFFGTREEIKLQASQRALNLLRLNV